MLAADTIDTARLTLTPLRVADAGELAPVLADPRLHEFTGGAPESAAELRQRYQRMLAGSGRPAETWLNWAVRLVGGTAIGTVQATVLPARTYLAWVIGVPWQGNGYATEAAIGLVAWLRSAGVRTVAASVHPAHGVSAAVAAAAGLAPTGEFRSGERVWLARFDD